VRRLPAEWEEHNCILVTYPHKKSDWDCCLDEIKKSYKEFIKAIIKYEKCLVICDNVDSVKNELKEITNNNLCLIQIDTNDTWIRDYGAIDVQEGDSFISYDFTFNGWGGKFDAKLDNEINQKLYNKKIFTNKLIKDEFIFEGGSIDTNGDGILLTTKKCLLNPNRNPSFSKEKIEKRLQNLFGIKRVIWLENGALVGDDTDSHIDTLARFLDKKTIAYVKCYDKNDEHYEELNKMEKELQKTDFNLIPLPLPRPIFYKDERLPATYLNFLFLNGAILIPIYNCEFDDEVIAFFKNFYPKMDIIPINATIFIREHGSLHCASMQRFAKLRI